MNLSELQELVMDREAWHAVTVDKNPPANAGDTDLIPGPGRFQMLWSN